MTINGVRFKLTFLILLLSVGNVHASPQLLQEFNDVNFKPISSGTTCGIHIEVSGRNLIFTNIAPSHETAAEFCSQLSSGCGGESYSLVCQQNGDCYSRKGNGALVLQLLNDGNIFFVNSGRKYLRNFESFFRWCVYSK